MAEIKINVHGVGENAGDTPIVILGPNGSGKTKLAQRIAADNAVTAIGAQRRTWLDDQIPVEPEDRLAGQINNQQNQWQARSWQPTEEINQVLSTLVQEHSNRLTRRNEEAIDQKASLEPVTDTKLIMLQGIWKRLFPKRKLEIAGFFPTVKRLDATDPPPVYQLKEMSDGERTVLYMAGRVMTASQKIILVDEPELHMHSRLSIQFWDEAEKLRPDCRFVYITHDLNFALSRRNALYLLARSDSTIGQVSADQLPASAAAEVLGAATLPFYARRIFLYEGEPERGFASTLFTTWFDDPETFSIPAGDRSSVCAAVAGLKKIGLVAAEVVGLIDRDFDSDEKLAGMPGGVEVLKLHEIESILCDQNVVAAISEHLGTKQEEAWSKFIDHVRGEFQGTTLGQVIATRVRSRVGDLLDGAFNGSQIDKEIERTAANHVDGMNALDLPGKVKAMFEEEYKRASVAISSSGEDLLALLPGKHLLGILSRSLGFKGPSDLVSMVINSISRTKADKGEGITALGEKIEKAFLRHLPPRRV